MKKLKALEENEQQTGENHPPVKAESLVFLLPEKPLLLPPVFENQENPAIVDEHYEFIYLKDNFQPPRTCRS